MERKFIILCEAQMKAMMEKEPIINQVLGTYASTEIAENALKAFRCPSKHFIVEAVHWRRISL